MRSAWLLVRHALWLLPLLVSGCVAELLSPPATILDYTCAILDPNGPQSVVVQSWGDAAFDAADLIPVLAGMSGRPASAFHVETAGAAPAAARVDAWAEQHPGLQSGDLYLRVLWLADGAVNETGRVVAPGIIALNLPALERGAARVNHTAADVARAVLLHHLGHALGVVNSGIPVADPDIRARESPPQHDPDPFSVMHMSWEDSRTVAWARNATYDGYSANILGDWAAARAPGGVCA